MQHIKISDFHCKCDGCFHSKINLTHDVVGVPFVNSNGTHCMQHNVRIDESR
jgi:hypothetical protein